MKKTLSAPILIFLNKVSLQDIKKGDSNDLSIFKKKKKAPVTSFCRPSQVLHVQDLVRPTRQRI